MLSVSLGTVKVWFVCMQRSLKVDEDSVSWILNYLLVEFLVFSPETGHLFVETSVFLAQVAHFVTPTVRETLELGFIDLKWRRNEGE